MVFERINNAFDTPVTPTYILANIYGERELQFGK